jgi:hypothetical protein
MTKGVFGDSSAVTPGPSFVLSKKSKNPMIPVPSRSYLCYFISYKSYNQLIEKSFISEDLWGSGIWDWGIW